METEMTTFPRAAALALILTAAPACAALAQTAAGSEAVFRATTLNLNATGEVLAAPDIAVIGLGVTTISRTAAEAMAANARQMAQAMTALKAAGIAPRDIQTSRITLNAQYAYDQGQAPRLTGYQAANQVTVTVHDLTRLGMAVDATVSAGINQVNGISFALSNPGAAETAAREAAVRALQAKADLYARATGYRVSRLVSLGENGGYEAPQPMPMMAMSRMEKSDTPVSPGELKVRIEVNGVYELVR